MLKPIVMIACALAAGAVLAKLPPPTPEQAAAAELAKAKTAFDGKVAAYQLCMSETRVAEITVKQQKAKGKTYSPEATPPCTPPGTFVPPVVQAAAAPAPAPAKK